MGKMVVIANQKGGVGKTTTSINLAAVLGEMNLKTLIIDLDPQSNATTGLAVDHNALEVSIYDVMVRGIPVIDILIHTQYKNLDLLPSNKNLAAFQSEVTEDVEEKEYFLKKITDPLHDSYDYILVDLPPALGILSINAFVAGESVLIPLQCEFYALEGVAQLMDTIERVRVSLNTELELEGVVLTMFDGRTNLSSQVVSDVKDFFKEKVYNTIIPRNVRISEAPSFGQPISVYDASSIGAKSYRVFAEEFVNNG